VALLQALVVDPSAQEAAKQLVRRFLSPNSEGLEELLWACSLQSGDHSEGGDLQAKQPNEQSSINAVHECHELLLLLLLLIMRMIMMTIMMMIMMIIMMMMMMRKRILMMLTMLTMLMM
jgi:hypothetical protein